MVARMSNYAAMGHGWFFTEYFVAYLCFFIGAVSARDGMGFASRSGF